MSKAFIEQSLVSNNDKLKKILSIIPLETGCYLMKNNKGVIIYIGKSKSLRSRVRSYFSNSVIHTPRISLMIRQVYDIEYIITDTESEALTLESNLIKNHQPYYNILLKDDKKYPYICIKWSEEYPRILITRRRRSRSLEDKFYGPFVDVSLLRKVLSSITSLFPIRQRQIPLYKDRVCLNYSIGKCPGVCQSYISAHDYRSTISSIALIFQGRADHLKLLLSDQMKNFSENMEYEKAAQIRDQIKGLDKLFSNQKVLLPNSTICRDILGIAIGDHIACIQIFQMRSGKLISRLAYTVNCSGISIEIIIQKIIEQHYSLLEAQEIPPEILIPVNIENIPILEDWLSELRNRKVKLVFPIKSKKANLIKLVNKNAQYELVRIQSGRDKLKVELEHLSQILQLNFLPRRIEGYDISHISGAHPVGSQVVFVDGLPAKQHYRQYKIKTDTVTVGHSDDYKSLGEVIKRRFRRWSELKSSGIDIQKYKSHKASILDPITTSDWPDLIVIDGGKGQLSAAIESLRELNLENEINICALAKKKEQIYVPGKKAHLDVDLNDNGLLLLRRLRNEAHRFAVSLHRNIRRKEMTRSQLSDIPGIGGKRIKSLLSHFHSIKAIQLASQTDLMNVPGIGLDVAHAVWEYFHPDSK